MKGEVAMFLRSKSRFGVGRTEILVFVALGAVAAMVGMYLNQKPKVIEHTVVIQQEAPPPPPAQVEAPTPVVVAPTPPPPRPVVAEAPPPPPPPTPECVIIEGKLKDAQDEVAQAQADLDAAKKASIDNFHQTDDYKNAMQDLKDKEAARKAAVAQLAADNETGSDTDHDTVAIQTAAQDLITAKAKIIAIEADSLANDSTIGDKQTALKSASDTVVALQQQLEDYDAKAILDSATAGCSIDSISMDPKTWTIEAKMTPSNQTNAGAAADAAFNQIGVIINKCLFKSPFAWQTAKFTVYADTNGNHVPLFQMIYSRDLVDLADQTKLFNRHYNNQTLVDLAQSIWLSHSVNSIQGISSEARVIQTANQSRTPMVQYTDSLQIGGYARTDGTFCPATFIRKTYSEALPVQAVGASVPYLPSFTNENPFDNPPR